MHLKPLSAATSVAAPVTRVPSVIVITGETRPFTGSAPGPTPRASGATSTTFSWTGNRHDRSRASRDPGPLRIFADRRTLRVGEANQCTAAPLARGGQLLPSLSTRTAVAGGGSCLP